jgi:hypothetical protein
LCEQGYCGRPNPSEIQTSACLRQCVYELKQENEQLKTELAAIKAKLSMQ